jgi:glutathione synthase/RimK-type ligase-like ATP-grasp enzyme
MSGPAVPRFTLIGDPALNRVQFFIQAAQTAGASVDVLPYSRILQNESGWWDALAGRHVKLESPGKDFEVYRGLLRRGATQPLEPSFPRWTVAEVDQLQSDPGLIIATRQWYLGWRNLLEAISAHGARVGATFFNSPAEIAVLFDKPACHRVLQEAGVPVPEAVPVPSSFDELMASLQARSWRRAFLKISHGSAANGVAALAFDHSGRLRLHTAVELAGTAEEPRLYSTRRMRVYDRPAEIRRLVDALCRERLHVERWIPKAGLLGRTADARVVVIRGRACHLMLRLAQGPITNLHLGATKADEETLARVAGPAAVTLLRTTAERAAACFPHSSCVGVDLALTPGFRQAFVLEVNAFGDLLEDWLWQGADTYTWQLRALAQPDWPDRARAQVSFTGL